MNVRLIKNWQWESGLVYNDNFYINQYTARIYMHTTTMFEHDHDVAYQRLSYWFDQVMQDSVMLSQDCSTLDSYNKTGQRILIFPDQPVDQLIGIMLCLKLNSICEQRLVITDVELGSYHGGEMIYQHNHAENIGPLSVNGWWHDPRPNWSHLRTARTASNVVALNRPPEWSNLDLDWEDCDDKPSSIVVADFGKDEDQ